MNREEDKLSVTPSWHYPGTFRAPDPKVDRFKIEVSATTEPVSFGRFRLPARFTIVPVRQMKGRPLIDVAVDAGGLRCIAVRERPGSSGLKAKSLRLPIDKYLVAAVRAIAQEPVEKDGKEDWLPALGAGHDQSAVAAVRRMHEGRRVPDERLQLVADIYRKAEAVGLPPTRYVEEVFPGKVPRKTVERWIRMARARGFLPPVDRKEK